MVVVLAGCSGSTARGTGAGATRTPSSVGSAPTSSVPGSSPTTAATTTSSSTTTTAAPSPTITQSGSTPQALIATLQAFFEAGCNGGCTRLSEPATAFTVTADHNNPDWSRWTVNDPSIGSGYGYAELMSGAWQIAAGPGSGEVGCPPATHLVPTQILSDFGAACPSGE